VICPNGHSVCYQCCRGMRSCPQCRAPCLDKPIPNISLLKTLDNLVNLKVLVLGAAGVGKSSLMLRFTDDRFMPDILPTVGLDFRVKVIEHRGFSVKLSIWDTAGQERFQNISSSYYRGAQGAILVYDITSAKSLERLDTWHKELDKYDSEEGMVRLVVGTKVDQVGRRQVTSEEGATWAADKDMLFLETSAKKHDGVDTVFTVLVDQILQRPQLWDCESQSRDEGGQSGLSLGSLRGHMGPGVNAELGCCTK